MRVVFKRSFAAAAALFAFVAIAVGSVSAQTNNDVSGNGFRISPVRSEINVDKGKSASLTITIENPTEFDTVAKPIVNDFVASDKENGEPLLILEDVGSKPANSFSSLVQPISDVNLGPKEKKDITVNLSVPADAKAGGYYGAIRFAPSTVNNTGNVSLTASVGTIVLVTVNGNLTEKLSLKQLSAGQNDEATGFITKGDVQSIVRLENTGDIHVKPFGRIEVKNIFGKTVATAELNATEPRANVLPGSTRKFVNSLDNKTWLGRYTIEANIGYSQGGGDVITAKSVFWYIPIWSLFVLGGLVLAIAAGVFFLVRKIKKGSHRR